MSMTKRLFEEVMDSLDFIDDYDYQYNQYLNELRQREEEMELDFVINQFFCN